MREFYLYFFLTNLKGFSIARCRSTAIAVRVNTDTFTHKACTKGQNGHIKLGKIHRWSKAAWNWNLLKRLKLISCFIKNYFLLVFLLNVYKSGRSEEYWSVSTLDFQIWFYLFIFFFLLRIEMKETFSIVIFEKSLTTLRTLESFSVMKDIFNICIHTL